MSSARDQLLLGEHEDLVDYLLDRVDDLVALGHERHEAEAILASATRDLKDCENSDQRGHNLLLAQGIMMVIAKRNRDDWVAGIAEKAGGQVLRLPIRAGSPIRRR